MLVIFLGLFVGTIYYLFQKSQKDPENFQTQTPVKMNIINKTVATGSVVPRKEIEIKPQVSGIVTEILVEAGDFIKKGDPIARITIVPDMVTLNGAESRVAQAKLSLNDSKLNYNREKLLYEKGVTPKTSFQQIEFALNSAQEELRAAENNLELIREGATKNSGANTNTIVRSTNTGMILDVPVEEGFSVIETNNFNAGTTIATVADMNDMIFEGNIDESEVGKIKVGMPLIIKVGAIDNLTFDANLTYIAPKGVKENNAIQFEIKADVTLKESDFLRAGYSANADIVLQRIDSVMAISESLLQFENGKPFVEIEVKPQVFEKKFIKTGLSDGLFIEVKEGLRISDKIKVFNAPQATPTS